MTTVYLVRHGATEWNFDKRAQGMADIPLTQTGKEEAQLAREQLGERGVGGRLLQRPQPGLRHRPDHRGRHTGSRCRPTPRSERSTRASGPGSRSTRSRSDGPNCGGRPAITPPGREARARWRSGSEPSPGSGAWSRPIPTASVVIVSHGGTIRWLSAAALGYDDRRSARIRGLGNGGIVSIEARLDDGDLKLANLTRLDGNTPDLDDPND